MKNRASSNKLIHDKYPLGFKEHFVSRKMTWKLIINSINRCTVISEDCYYEGSFLIIT